jgi:hypothetical protein
MSLIQCLGSKLVSDSLEHPAHVCLKCQIPVVQHNQHNYIYQAMLCTRKQSTSQTALTQSADIQYLQWRGTPPRISANIIWCAAQREGVQIKPAAVLSAPKQSTLCFSKKSHFGNFAPIKLYADAFAPSFVLNQVLLQP